MLYTYTRVLEKKFDERASLKFYKKECIGFFFHSLFELYYAMIVSLVENIHKPFSKLYFFFH